MIQPSSGCMLGMVAVTGRNQNASRKDPACLLGNYFFFFKLNNFKAKTVKVKM